MNVFSRKPKPTWYEIGGAWGDAIQWVRYDTGRVAGWKLRKPLVDDLLAVPMQSGNEAVFRFVKVDPCLEPKDMFFGTVKLLGYSKDLPDLPPRGKHGQG